jgi:hypothetical protein
LNFTQKIINPAFIVNTGDLVDSDYKGFFQRHTGQRTWEWELYQDALTSTGMNSSFYFDMMGNHDVYSNPSFTFYRNYSMSKEIYYDFTITTDFGKYHFITLHVPEEYGIRYPFHLFGYLNRTELDWYENRLKEHSDSNLTFTFGHMPAYEIAEGKYRFFSLNHQYGVDLYLCGHDHLFNHEMIDGRMPSYCTGHMTDGFRIIVIDNDIISTAAVYNDKWPVGVISSPVSVQNINMGLSPSRIRIINEVRVLAWDPTGIKSVEWRATTHKTDSNSWSSWSSMNHVDGPLYSASWMDSLVDDEYHLIQANITNVNHSSHIEEILYRSSPKSFFTLTHKTILLTGLIFGLVIGVPMGRYVLRSMSKLPQKKGDQKVDPILSRLLLVKIILFLIVPLTFAPIFPGTITAVFAWGYLGF